MSLTQARQCTYKRNTKSCSYNSLCRAKSIIITHYECVSVVLVIQHAKRMRRIILSSVACLGCTIFSHILA